MASSAGNGASALRRQVGILKRAFSKNAALRAEHEKAPRKWESSELALHAAVHDLTATAATPALYAALIAQDGILALVHILAHQNVDIVASALHALADLGDTEGETSLDTYETLLDALIAAEAFDGTVAALRAHATPQTLADDEVAHEVLTHALAIFDHALELRPAIARAAIRADIAPYIADTLTALASAKSGSSPGKRKWTGDMEPLAQAAARLVETAALLLHDAPNSRVAFIEAGGVRALLDATEMHSATGVADAVEAARNALGALCGVLLAGAKARDSFVHFDGIERILALARTSAALRAPVARLLDFALMACPTAVARAFAGGAVGVLFALLTRAARTGIRSDAEHVLGAIFSMFRYADMAARDRLLFKFWQRSGDKIYALLALYTRHVDALAKRDDAHASFFLRGEGDSSVKAGDGAGEAAAYLELLDAGLFIVQLAGVITAHVLAYAPVEMRGVVQYIMLEFGVLEPGVCNAVIVYADSIEAADGSEDALRDRKEEQCRLRDLIKAVGTKAVDSKANGDG